MLILLFQLGKDRYALEASRVVEVVPLLALKHLPQSPPGIAGVFNYRGRPVPASDIPLEEAAIVYDRNVKASVFHG